MDTVDVPVLSPGGLDRPEARLQPAVADALAALDRTARVTILVNDPQRHTASTRVLEALSREIDIGKSSLFNIRR